MAQRKFRRAAVIRATFSAIAAIVFPGMAHASEQDVEAWGTLWATGSISGRMLGSLDVSIRASDSGTRAPTVLIRPLIGLHVAKGLSLWSGYTYVATRPDSGSVASEHRAVQQVLWTPPLRGRASLTSRTRLELRWVEGRPGTGVRLREMLRFAHPLGHGKTALVLQSEPFFNLNDTAFGGGFDQVRTFVGVNIGVGKGVSADLGYMNRYVARRTAADRIDHIPSAMLVYRF